MELINARHKENIEIQYTVLVFKFTGMIYTSFDAALALPLATI